MTIKGYISIAELEKVVGTKLNDIGIRNCDYPIDPYELIQNENILLQETPFSDNNIRGMTVHGPNKTGIIINSNCGPIAKRFIAMHELAHIWFHPRKTKRICLEEYTKLRRGEEWQANNAAAIALMPTELVIDLHEHYHGYNEFMCEFFGVGKDAMTYRLERLKLISPKKEISESKFLYHEPDPVISMLENRWLYGE